MRNPFAIPLGGGPLAAEYGFANDSFDLPSDVELNTADYPELTGLGGGVAAYRGNQGEQFQDSNPGYAGAYALGFVDAPGLATSYQGLNPAPGSADLIQARDTGGIPGTDRIIRSTGPVSGVGSEFTGIRDTLHPSNPNYAGPVTGGPDYGQKLAATYFAAQAQQFSAEAMASAMVSSV